jgi:hypothetical protein
MITSTVCLDNVYWCEKSRMFSQSKNYQRYIMQCIDQKAESFSFGGTLLHSQSNIWVDVKQFKRNRPNSYQPIGINIKANVCEATAGGTDSVFFKILEFYVPDFQVHLKSVLRPCPYLPGRVEVFNVTVPNAIYSTSFIKGNIKFSVRFYNGKNETLFEYLPYVLIN